MFFFLFNYLKNFFYGTPESVKSNTNNNKNLNKEMARPEENDPPIGEDFSDIPPLEPSTFKLPQGAEILQDPTVDNQTALPEEFKLPQGAFEISQNLTVDNLARVSQKYQNALKEKESHDLLTETAHKDFLSARHSYANLSSDEQINPSTVICLPNDYEEKKLFVAAVRCQRNLLDNMQEIEMF